MHRSILAAALLVLAGCADSEPAELVPLENVARGDIDADPSRDPIAAEEELALGEWGAGTVDDRPALQFGPRGAGALFSLRCDGGGGIDLFRHGVVTSPGNRRMTIGFGDVSTELSVEQVEGPLPMLRSAAPANHPLLTALPGAQQPIRIALGDGEALLLPPSPQIGEFIRGCSGGGTAPAPAAQAPADNGQAGD